MENLEQIKSYIQMLDENECEVGTIRGEINYFEEIEKKLNLQFPEIYKRFIGDIKGGFFPNDFFDIHIYGKEALWDHNIINGEPHLRGYLIFALTTDSEYVFFDVNNTLDHGKDALFRIASEAKKIHEAKFLARNFTALFQLLANNQEPNDLQLK